MVDKGKEKLLRGKKKLGKPIFNDVLFGWLYAQDCFPMQKSDATLRGKDSDTTLSDRDKNTP